MVLYRRSRVTNAPYFFTVTLRDRRARHLPERHADLRAAFREARARYPFRIDALVVLPDHFHLLCTLPDDDADFSTRVRVIKRGFTIRLRDAGIAQEPDHRGEYKLWQRWSWEHTIRDERGFQHHVDYIHYNPVKHGWVANVREWPHSSFHRYVRRGLLPMDWSGTDS